MTTLLRFEDVALWRGGRLLFEGMSFTVRAGEAVQVTGPNGSGKSSLIRLAAGLLHAARGTVERRELALADDFPALDRELPLARALAFWTSNAQAAMERLGIAALAHVPVRFLSSGQLKRAGLALVAASGAPLWLLDEPLNALDTDGIARLAAIVGDHLTAGGGVLAASHQPLPGQWRTLGLQP